MPNPQIEQLQHKLKRSNSFTRIALGIALFFVVLTVMELQDDSWWFLLAGALATIAGSGVVGGFMERRIFEREISNYQMIDEQHIHGKPSPFVDTPPPNPESSTDNFWGKR